MTLFTKSRAPSSNQVKIVKAVNGGAQGHRERKKLAKRQNKIQTRSHYPVDDFWDAIDEAEFARQDPTTTPVLRNDRPLQEKIDSFRRRRRQYSSETPNTRQSSTQRDGRDNVSSSPEDFWRKPTQAEEAELAKPEAAILSTSPEGPTATIADNKPPAVITIKHKKKPFAFLKKFF